MIDHLVVYNGNSVNRYGMAFTVEALESGLEQSWEIGVPSFFSHDFHRPIAWSRGLCLHIESGLVRLVGVSSIPENEEESDGIREILSYHLSNRISGHFETHRDELVKILAPHLSDKAIECFPDCAAFFDEGLAIKVFPDTFNLGDKDGLTPISALNPIAPGIYKEDELIIFAHPYFRRSLSRLNTLNVPFLKIIQDLATRENLDIRIALDSDMIGLAKTFKEHIELEYWWGPKFNDNLDKIPPGVTIHNANEQQRLFHGISRTEFWWHSQDQDRSFECEEIRDIPSYGVGTADFGCRYVHCKLDPSNRKPSHLDGAIRMYDEASMISRIEKDIKWAGKHSKYTKLWRIDGALDVSEWKEFLTHYFRDNHLVGEYLGARDDSEFVKPQRITSKTYAENLMQYVPCNMSPGQGIRIAVSYHPKSEENKEGRFIKAFDTITYESVVYNYIEADSLELIKLFRRKGENLTCPVDIYFIVFEDQVLNLPLISHLGTNSVETAEQTYNLILELCEVWQKRGDDRVVSFNIGIQYHDRDVYFSFAGHVSDFVIWNQLRQQKFPGLISDIGKWCNDTYNLITKNFPESRNNPRLHNMLQKSGILLFVRRFLEPQDYQLRMDNNNKNLLADIVIPKDNKELLEILSLGRLSIAPIFFLIQSKCSKCNAVYQSCNCSKYMDENITEIITEIEMLGAFWTNRKA